MNTDKTVVGKCPVCGGNVIKTLKGWACEHSIGNEAKCQFFLFSTIGNRRISDAEAKQFLAEKEILLDGFATKEGKAFTSILNFNLDGTVNMTSQIGICPKCGGTLYVGSRSVSCSNFKHPDNPCKFTIWRNVGGNDLSLAQLKEILGAGATSEALTIYDTQGNKSVKKLGLNMEREVVQL